MSQVLYDDPCFCGFAENSLRPGGLALTAGALRFAALPSRAKVLDIGCGYGKTIEYLEAEQGFEAWGIEKSGVMLAKALVARPNLKIQLGEATALPFGAATFDCVLAECVFCLIEKPKLALQEIKRVLKPGGKLILSDLYARGVVLSSLSSKTQVKQLLAQANFDFLVWQDCKTIYKSFVAEAIMACNGRQDYQKRFAGVAPADLKVAKISYYLGIWQNN